MVELYECEKCKKKFKSGEMVGCRFCKSCFRPEPTDSKLFWLDAHCGAGTTDLDELCAFCGFTHKECAETFTEGIKKDHSGSCGGSGFWCPACGEFYAQDSCGERGFTDFINIREKWFPEKAKEFRLKADKDYKIYCSCGEFLFFDEYTKASDEYDKKHGHFVPKRWEDEDGEKDRNKGER